MLRLSPKVKEKFLMAVLVVLVALVVFLVHKDNKQMDNLIETPVLQPGQQSKIILDPVHHTVRTITKAGTVQTVLPNNRPVSVVLNEDGTLHVNVRKWGFEFNPVLGASYGDTLRANVGANLFFVRGFDLGLSVAPALHGRKPLKIIGFIGYNIYSNTSLYIGIDNSKQPHVGATIRF